MIAATQQQLQALATTVGAAAAPQHAGRIVVREVKLPRLGGYSGTTGTATPVNTAVLNAWLAQAVSATPTTMTMDEAWALWMAALDGAYQQRFTARMGHLLGRPAQVDSLVALLGDFFTTVFTERRLLWMSARGASSEKLSFRAADGAGGEELRRGVPGGGGGHTATVPNGRFSAGGA
jgi:hypothetical protein